jgi:hypothetical protein
MPMPSRAAKGAPRLVLRSSHSNRFRIPVSHRGGEPTSPSPRANAARDAASERPRGKLPR